MNRYVPVASPHKKLKLQWLLVSDDNGNWLNAYIRSKDVNQTFPGTFLIIICAAESMSSWMFGIWYLFFQIWAFIGLASRARLIEASFFAVNTIGAMKNLSYICPIFQYDLDPLEVFFRLQLYPEYWLDFFVL